MQPLEVLICFSLFIHEVYWLYDKHHRVCQYACLHNRSLHLKTIRRLEHKCDTIIKSTMKQVFLYLQQPRSQSHGPF